MDDWQLECCGESFAVGDRVDWRLRAVDSDRYATSLPEGSGIRIEWEEEHHEPDGSLVSISGEVLSIFTVWDRRERGVMTDGPLAGRAGWLPIPGSAMIIATEEATGDEAGDDLALADGKLLLNGYAIELAAGA
jgi:hypothetical protein